MTDHDKKFKEDLERAQALSLESLALEQFKHKRLQELGNLTNNNSQKNEKNLVSRAASLNDDSMIQRPRPPGYSIAGSTKNTSLIAPPPPLPQPPSQRRHSAAPDTQEDLISFSSPPLYAKDVLDFSDPQNLISTQSTIKPPITSYWQNQSQYGLSLLTRPIGFTVPTSRGIPTINLPTYQTQNYYPPSQTGVYYPQLQVSASHTYPRFLGSTGVNNSQIGFVSKPISGTNNGGTPRVNPPLSNNHAVKREPSPPALPPKNQHRKPPLNSSLPPKSSAAYLKLSSASFSSSPSLSLSNNINNNKTNESKPGEKVDGTSCNLIDCSAQVDDKNSVRVSILQEFDPILSDSQSCYHGDHGRSVNNSENGGEEEIYSMSGSVYDDYYDYHFIYSGSGNNSNSANVSVMSDSMYATINRSIIDGGSPQSPTPSSRMSTIDRKMQKNVKKILLECIVKNDKKDVTADRDLIAFYKMVLDVRKCYKYNDPDTNMGLVISPMVKYKYDDGLSIKLRIHPNFEGADFQKPISFTCDVTSSVDHVTLQLVYNLEAPTNQNYTLKVWGCNEYLVPTTLLSDYEYIHNCIKLDEDVILILIPDYMKDKTFARTIQDDYRDKELTFEKIVSRGAALMHIITYDSLKILLETIENEMNQLEQQANQLKTSINAPALQPLKVRQSIKCIINLMGDLCTLDLMLAVDNLTELCGAKTNEQKFTAEMVSSSCDKVRLATQNLIEMYGQVYPVDYDIKPVFGSEPTSFVNEILHPIVIRICTLNRPSKSWNYEYYYITGQIYHGMRKVSKCINTADSKKSESDKQWPSVILFDSWLDFQDIPIASLARESRLVLQIYGKKLVSSENDEQKNVNGGGPVYKDEEIGWASVQFFDYDGVMIHGSCLLSVWPTEDNHINHMYGPAPSLGSHPESEHAMIGIEIVSQTSKIKFPQVDPDLMKNVTKGNFSSLDNETQELLNDACEQDMFYKLPAEVREILWEKRHYLYHIPKALPKVLLAAHSWASTCLPDLHGMLHLWKKLEPKQALELLLPVYPDIEVRKIAVKWMVPLSNDELIDYLPQLIVALRYETYENSSLAQFILHRALSSPRFAHYLFWLLSHNLPGSIPQNGTVIDVKDSKIEAADNISVTEIRYHRRMKLLLRSLLAICGESLRKCFLSQQLLVKQLGDVADIVKKSKDTQKITNMHRQLSQINNDLRDNPTSLPLSPTLRVNGIDIKGCFYFTSNTLPLKINFVMEDSSTYSAIFKVGDDLQQDMLTLQMIKLMDKLWLQEGLDLKIVTFNCIPTSKRKGMIEMVTSAETLRKIQTEHGLTGSFKDKPIAEWLAKHNPSELEYTRAVQNFTASCAGYCVVTYIMGICDRHNDNIMLKTSGHLFHIDFGKFLGDAQMIGNFKRDRAPFVLTSDMAYVINGGDRPTEKFHQFVDLCCQAFNIIRNNRNLFLFLMTFSSEICGITRESISYMHRALLPEMSNPEAAAHFTRLIEESLKTKFTQFNFFLHNLAQNLAQLNLFSLNNQSECLLSFVPKTYSIDTDGQLTHVEVVGYRKRYDPDKYYVYILRVYRCKQSDPMEIQRTYKEFCELHQKLCLNFPLAKLHSLSTGLHMGRQNIKQVAQKRFIEITHFIQSLFVCTAEIAHSDLVYTFFHPMLRDQQEDSYPKAIADKKSTNSSNAGKLRGQLKLSLQYSKGVFMVMVHHARGLPKLPPNGQEPSTYVKVYLQPDPQKNTKRKTKVVKKNCHPSFMEMLEYRMSIEIVKSRTLKATLWSHDPLQENEFMGGVELELSTLDLLNETTEWYPLGNLSR